MSKPLKEEQWQVQVILSHCSWKADHARQKKLKQMETCLASNSPWRRNDFVFTPERGTRKDRDRLNNHIHLEQEKKKKESRWVLQNLCICLQRSSSTADEWFKERNEGDGTFYSLTVFLLLCSKGQWLHGARSRGGSLGSRAGPGTMAYPAHQEQGSPREPLWEWGQGQADTGPRHGSVGEPDRLQGSWHPRADVELWAGEGSPQSWTRTVRAGGCLRAWMFDQVLPEYAPVSFRQKTKGDTGWWIL